jgi:hypothetical protein
VPQTGLVRLGGLALGGIDRAAGVGVAVPLVALLVLDLGKCQVIAGERTIERRPLRLGRLRLGEVTIGAARSASATAAILSCACITRFSSFLAA